MLQALDNKRIMRSIKNIDDNDIGLLGFTIADEIDCYEDTGDSVISIFKKNPDQAELLNKMLIAICGYDIEMITAKMEKKRNCYELI